MQEELQRNYDNVAAYVKNGIANQADLDAVKVEQLNNIQQRHTLEATYRAYGKMLSLGPQTYARGSRDRTLGGSRGGRDVVGRV